jgi:hypothetical protein
MADLIHDLAGMGVEAPRTSARAAAEWQRDFEVLQADTEATERCRERTRQAKPQGGKPQRQRTSETPVLGLAVVRLANGYTVVADMLAPRAAQNTLRWRPKHRPDGSVLLGEALFYTDTKRPAGEVEPSVHPLRFDYQPKNAGGREWLSDALAGKAFSMGHLHDEYLYLIHAKREAEARWRRIAVWARRRGWTPARIGQLRRRYLERLTLAPREQVLRQGGQEDAPRGA